MSVRNLSDEFMIWRYKVEFCSRKDNHDWATCPYAHDKEKAKRRDPACFNYASLPCPNTMQGRSCPGGDACPYTHSVQEYWLHPDRFKTQMCKNGSSCTRPLCFFAHKAQELRFPETEPVSSSTTSLPMALGNSAPVTSSSSADVAGVAAVAPTIAAPLPLSAPMVLLAGTPSVPLTTASLSAPAPAAVMSAVVPLIDGRPLPSDTLLFKLGMQHKLEAMAPPCTAALSLLTPGSGMFRFPAAPGSPQSASASLQQQQQQQQQQATQLRAYLEEQQLLVQLQCASLEQEQVRLGLLLGQLQTSAAVPSAQPLDAAPPSPVSVQTSALSGSSSICPGVGGDLNALLLQQVPMAAVNNEPLQLYPVSAALATAIAGGGALNGAAAWPVASAQQQIGVLPLAFDAGALRPLF